MQKNLATEKEFIKEGEYLNRKLALSHYENFFIAAWFLPRRLKQDLYNIYAFCRLADDFADEGASKSEAERELKNWESLLEHAVCGAVNNPVFSALGDTIQRRKLSIDNFKNLLIAFHTDLTINRYPTWNDLREYTRFSADPVGRIVLELYGYHNADYFALSDNICTALQLANHWQDVSEDFLRGRIYIPVEDLIRFDLTEDFFSIASPDKYLITKFKQLIKFEVTRAKSLFEEGYELIKKVNNPLKIQLKLYWYGGMKALEKIDNVDFDVIGCSTKLTKFDKLCVFSKIL